jgi:hypothetical protein
MRVRFPLLILAIAIMTTFTVSAGMKLSSNGSQASQIAAQQWGEVSEGFQLSASLAKDQITSGEPVLLKLSIRNTSEKALYLEEIGAEKEYKIDIRRESGEPVRLAERGQQMMDNEGNDFMVVGVKIEPGHEQHDSIEISKLHEMTARGTYLITVRRKVRKLDRTGWTEVVSNTVRVKVSEGFLLLARLEKEHVVIGEPVLLNLTLKNTTQEYLPLAQATPQGEYKLDIESNRGGKPPLTAYGQSLQTKRSVGISGSGLTLGPGQEQQDVVRVDKIYDFSLPGAYSITTSRIVGQPDRKGWTEVVSNTVTVLVTY